MPIPLRPTNAPMHRGYGPSMMPYRGYNGMQHGMHRVNGYQPYPQMGGFNPRMGATRGSNGGGLLAKILGKGKQQQGGIPSGLASLTRSSTPSKGAGGILKTLTNPEGISGFLNNTQNLLKTAQQFGPVIQQVQQYAPLIKNLPSLWKLYRGLSDTSEESNPPTTETEPATETEHDEFSVESSDFAAIEVIEDDTNVHKSLKKHRKSKNKKVTPKSTNKKEQPSIPKLYI